mmetsp:Transcript_6562/g.26718  ORF Transcript_6562/g.26718 Transcript_6562/m.26718 type:complete len:215 (+) Transcript_6562:226-870(+)
MVPRLSHRPRRSPRRTRCDRTPGGTSGRATPCRSSSGLNPPRLATSRSTWRLNASAARRLRRSSARDGAITRPSPTISATCTPRRRPRHRSVRRITSSRTSSSSPSRCPSSRCRASSSLGRCSTTGPCRNHRRRGRRACKTRRETRSRTQVQWTRTVTTAGRTSSACESPTTVCTTSRSSSGSRGRWTTTETNSRNPATCPYPASTSSSSSPRR